MLDAKTYQSHFPDDPAYAAEDARNLKSAALLEALAALQDEFRIILGQSAQDGE